MKIEFFKHNVGAEEKQAVLAVLDSIFLTTGETVAQFEKDLANYLNIPYCIGLSHCTGALHLALLALDLKAGDEIITTPMTFVATSLVIAHIGAKPIWVDVEKDTGNLNTDLIEAAITSKTRAILPVHLYGQMCDMKAIRKIADKYGLVVIEDAAHALESERDGIRVGELSDVACFSFYATKSITSGEGGAIVTRSKRIADKLRLLRAHGINKEVLERYGQNYAHWDLVDLGWKYNMSNIQAALLLPQLKKIAVTWQRRKEIDLKYREAFQNMPKLYPNAKSAHHLSTVWVDPKKRDSVLQKLQNRGIGVAVNYRPIHLLSKFKELYKRESGSFPEAERIGNSTISLPLYPKLTKFELIYIIANLKQILE